MPAIEDFPTVFRVLTIPFSTHICVEQDRYVHTISISEEKWILKGYSIQVYLKRILLRGRYLLHCVNFFKLTFPVLTRSDRTRVSGAL